MTITSLLFRCTFSAACVIVSLPAHAQFGDLLKKLIPQVPAQPQPAPAPGIPAVGGASAEGQTAAPKATKTPPSSANWTKIYIESGTTFYTDKALIRQDGLFVVIPYLVDLQQSPKISFSPGGGYINRMKGPGYPYKSVISVIRYDCSRKRFWATEDHFFFPGKMASGEPFMDPGRRKELQWTDGMEGSGQEYGAQEDDNNFDDSTAKSVGQSYFVVKVLNPQLKICSDFWKPPAGFVPPKTKSFVQKMPGPDCKGADVWKWQRCKATMNQSRPTPHLGSDLVFKAPGRYEGPVNYGSPQGWGTYTFEGGDRAGDIYIGFFDGGNFNGFGTYYHNAPNKLKGSIYIGHFRKHLKDGLGTYRYADGTPTQEGVWKEDRLDRPLSSIKTFFLDIRAGLPFCQGTDASEWTDCFGYLEFDSIRGQVLDYKRIDQAYAGGFKNGLPDGVGTFFDLRSYLTPEYQGGFKQGKYEGTGTLFGSPGSYYTGGFVGGKKQGLGVSRSTGSRYEGEWENDSFIKGTEYKENQYTYTGSFKGGMFHGEGRYTPAQKPGGAEPVVQEGVWKNGKLIPPEKPPAAESETAEPPAADIEGQQQ